MVDVIKHRFSNVRLTSTSFKKFIKECPDVEPYLFDVLKREPCWKTAYNVVCGIVNGTELQNCEVCGKVISFNRQNNTHCSKECVYNNKELQRKRMEVFQDNHLKKYGVKSPMHRQEVKDKIKNTCLDRYGVANVSSLDFIKEKRRKTNIERFGFSSPLKSPDLKEKQRQTNLKKYGCVCPLQSESVMKKTKKTNLAKFGVEHPSQNQEIKKKIANTNISCHGVHNLRLDKTVKKAQRALRENRDLVNDKRRRTSLKRYGVDNHEKINTWSIIESYCDYVVPLFSECDYCGYDYEYSWRCVKCGGEFKQRIFKTCFIKDKPYLPRCLVCFPYVKGYSYIEVEISDFIKSIYEGSIVLNSGKIIAPCELDIYLPDKKWQ